MLRELIQQSFEYLLPIDILVVHSAMAIRVLMHLSKAKKKAHDREVKFDWRYYSNDNSIDWAIAYISVWVLLWVTPEVIINHLDKKYWGVGVVMLIGFSAKEVVELIIKTIPAALKHWRKKYFNIEG